MNIQLIRNIGVALLAAASVYGQGSQRLVVQVPFGFHVGPSVLPSGEYTVDTHAAPGMMLVRSADSKSSAMLITIRVETQSTASKGRLIFHKYGDEYFLSQVWNPGSNTGSELPQSRREREIAANAGRAVETIMARK
jgi:hypothetical protein